MSEDHGSVSHLLLQATDLADLVTNVRKERHPIEDGQRARKGTEY